MINSVEMTKRFGLCSSCGVCKNVCPKNAIVYKREKGMFYPAVEEERCIECGICLKVCPGLSTEYLKEKTAIENVFGKSVSIYNAWSKNPAVRHVSASGGVVSILVTELLQKRLYDSAFCVASYDYHQQLTTIPIQLLDLVEGIENTSFPKSRYLPVSHENVIAYIKENREKRLIIVGTSCAIQGIRKMLKLWNRDESRYLLIGLFCDKVFNYNVLQYFESKFSDGKELEALHFKNKESGGWPGNMKFMFHDGSCEYHSKEERGNAKIYFMPEKCLYCIDKLNVQADISLGDNYTGQDSSSLGSNTVFIRNANGESAWNAVVDCLEFFSVGRDKVRTAQYLDERLDNRYFAALKEHHIWKKYGERVNLNQGISLEDSMWNYEQAYNRALNRLHAGAIFDANPVQIAKQLKKDTKYRSKKSPIALAERFYFSIKRRVKNRSIL